MPIATGINKKLYYKKEGVGTWGVLAGTAGAQSLRRVTSSLDLTKDTYKSNEIRDDFQTADFRHGTRKVAGTVSGELSPKTYSDFMAAAVRAAFAAGIAVTNTTTAAAVAAPQISGFNPMTAGLKIGNVVRFSGMSAGGNNNRNFLITTMTSTNFGGVFLDGGAAMAVAASGGSVTTTVVGKTASIPLTGHTDDSFTVEHWFGDVLQSETFTGCKVSNLAIKLPATGMATCDVGLMGKDVVTASGASYFASGSVVPQTTTGVLAAVNGGVVVAGVQIGTVTGADFTINANMSVESVVGSNFTPDIFEGPVEVSGNLSVFFENAIYRDIFLNETEASVVMAFTTSNSGTADFLAFSMTRVKAGGATKNDGTKGIVQTIPFTALLDVNGGAGTATNKTTLTIQDSAA